MTAYMRKYLKDPEHRRKHRENCRKNQKNYYKRHKSDILAYQKKHKPEQRRKRREKLLLIVGDTCILCGSKQYIQFHEIYGKNHPDLSCQVGYNYLLAHIKDFIPLCWRCHKGLHWVINLNNEQRALFLTMVKTAESL